MTTSLRIITTILLLLLKEEKKGENKTVEGCVGCGGKVS